MRKLKWNVKKKRGRGSLCDEKGSLMIAVFAIKIDNFWNVFKENAAAGETSLAFF